MRLLTGDECGLIKETIPEVGRPARKDSGPTNVIAHQITVDKGIQRIDGSKQSRSRAVNAMTWMETSGKFAALRADASIEVWEVENVFDSKSGGRPLLALGYSNERLCAADSLGNVAIVNPDKAAVVATYSAYSSSKQGATITYTKGQVVNTQLATAMATSTCGQIAVGGRERETTIMDINNGAQIWKAKNLPPDAQTLLQQPVWSTSLTFLNSTLLLAGTAYKQVRLYDIRSNSRRPVSYTPEGLLEHRVTALCGIDEHLYVVGDAAGYLSEVDIRMAMGKSKKSRTITIPRFVGPVGSIRQIVRHHTKPLIACVGLDRMLRTYSCKTRRQIDCIYLKQRLNCVLFCEDEELESDEIRYDDVEDKDVDVEDDVQDYVVSDEEGESERDETGCDVDEGDERDQRSDGGNDDSDDDHDESDDDDDIGESDDDDSDDDSRNGDNSADSQSEDGKSVDSDKGPFTQAKKKRRQ